MGQRAKKIGTGPVRGQDELYLPDGILGFEDHKTFSIPDNVDLHPFIPIVSSDNSAVSFILVDPEEILPQPYELGLSESDKDILDLQPGDSVSVFVLVSSASGAREITANLKGPVVVNNRNRVAKQVVVYNPAYSLRHPVYPLEASTRETARISRMRASA